ncbi:NAD(P)-binding protein [Calocera viscosa TUFC12733]|uniref:NAD(P)-binding protein n=1 Tax=Calocera viscosa (strain TUFC12733) TaxID=1330018 RepID=A0A167MU08_CALVF|nr:NAD(P)-binding protein [Calocera viscosa TUFC12733]
MSKNVGIVISSAPSGKLAPAQPVELPTPGEGELLIKIEAAAQNPVDQLQADGIFPVASFPALVGTDAAGTVVSLGPGVARFAINDRVATMTPLIDAAKYGTYQQYCVSKAAGTIHLPASLSFDEAATFPLAFYTAAMGVHWLLGVPLPLDETGKVAADVGTDEWFLVWGASSSVGAFAVQLAKAAGFHVIATASPANFEYVKSLGADVVLDYHDRAVSCLYQLDKIQAAASFSLAYDAISEGSTTDACIASLSSEGGKVIITLPYSGNAPDSVEVIRVLSGTAYVPEKKEDTAGLTRLWQALVNEGRLKPNPVKASVMPNGLNSIDEGFDLQRKHKVSGQKLVYHPQETPV